MIYLFSNLILPDFIYLFHLIGYISILFLCARLCRLALPLLPFTAVSPCGPFSVAFGSHNNYFQRSQKEASRAPMSVFFHIHGAEVLSNYHKAHNTTQGNTHKLYNGHQLWICKVVNPEMFENTGLNLASQSSMPRPTHLLCTFCCV